MKKVVMNLDLHDIKEKQKIARAIYGLSEIDSIEVEMKMTLVGKVDPVQIVQKLRNLRRTKIVSICPKKEDEEAEAKKHTEKEKDPNKQKVVMNLDFHDDKEKQKAMEVISGLPGIDSIAVDTKQKNMTVVGEVDPVEIVGKLRTICHTEIESVWPVKEEKKPEANEDAKKSTEPDALSYLVVCAVVCFVIFLYWKN